VDVVSDGPMITVCRRETSLPECGTTSCPLSLPFSGAGGAGSRDDATLVTNNRTAAHEQPATYGTTRR
jgi:hypothetical protein